MTTKSELEQRVVELEAAQVRSDMLYQISRDLNMARDTSELLQVLARPALDAGTQRATLWYIERDQAGKPEWIKLVAHWEHTGELYEHVGVHYYVPEFHLAGLWLSSKDKPLLISDTSIDDRVIETARKTYAEMNTQATAILPLVQAGHRVGLFTFNWTETREFGEQEVALYQALVDLVAPTVAAHRLAQDARAKAEELAVLNELSTALTTRLTVDEVLKEAYQQASRLIDTTNFFIALYNADRREVVFPLFTDSEADREIPVLSVDKGLTGYIIRNRTSLLFEQDVRTQQEAMGVPLVGDEPQSWLGVPMIIGDQVLGVMVVQSYTRPRFYGKPEQALLMAIASQTAIALQNARLFEETENRAKQMAAVNRIAKVTSATLDLDDLAEMIYQEVTSTFKADAFFISLYDQDTNQVDVRLLVDEGVRATPRQGPLGGLTEIVVTEKQPLIIRNEEELDRMLSRARLTGSGKAPESWLGAPMMIGERVIGVISVQAYRSYAWDQEDEELLFTITDQMAVAIENARLFEESRSRAQEMTVLNELGQALTAHLSVEQVLHETYRQASRLLDTTNFAIGLYEPEKDEIVLTLSITESKIDERIITIPASQGVVGHIVRTRTGVLIETDLAKWQAETGVEMVGQPALSWLGVPLIVGDRFLGVMDVQSFTTSSLYDKHHQELFTLIGNQVAIALQNAQMVETLEQRIQERTAELRQSLQEQEQLQQQVIDAQKQTLKELSTPIIPIMEHIIVMPLIGSIDTMRARDVTRSLLAGVRKHQAKVVILDITGVPIVDSGVAGYLNRTIQAARLKGAHTIVTGISEAVAETIVELGIDWTGIETLPDLRMGLRAALARLGRRIRG
ncbi:MAG: GAF domain-containing protein [Chloroflexi bacterium]|nr:GAF domain-containing protein [Chloroflexota bacterium]